MVITLYQVIGTYGENCPDTCYGGVTEDKEKAEERLASALAYKAKRKQEYCSNGYTGAEWCIVETIKVIKDTEEEE